MILKETVPINAGLLISNSEVIAICDGGIMEQECFIPDQFVYDFMRAFPVKVKEEKE